MPSLPQPGGGEGTVKSSGAGSQYTMENIAYIVQNWWNWKFPDVTGNLATAVAIAWAESKGNIKAHNSTPPDDSYGLWQINMYGSLGPDRRRRFNLSRNDDLFSATTNARVAHALWLTGGWRPWSTYTNGAYKAYLAEAKEAVKKPTAPGNVNTDGPNQTDTINLLFDPLFKFIREGALRGAGFIGGAALIIGAIVLVTKRGVK